MESRPSTFPPFITPPLLFLSHPLSLVLHPLLSSALSLGTTLSQDCRWGNVCPIQPLLPTVGRIRASSTARHFLPGSPQPPGKHDTCVVRGVMWTRCEAEPGVGFVRRTFLVTEATPAR